MKHVFGWGTDLTGMFFRELSREHKQASKLVTTTLASQAAASRVVVSDHLGPVGNDATGNVCKIIFVPIAFQMF